MREKLVAFDIYDTWVSMDNDTNPYKTLFSRLGVDIGADIRQALQTRNEDIIQILEKLDLRKNVDEDMITEFEQNLNNQLQSIKVYDDFLPLVRYLKAKGYKIAAISNLSKPYSAPLELPDIDKAFDHKILSYEVGYMKPNEQIFQQLKNASGIQLSDSIMVGDRLDSDVQGGLNAGMRVIRIDRKTDKIIEHGDYISVPKLESIKEIL